MIDSYFDLHNFERPVASFLTEKFYYYLNPGLIKYTDIYLKENKLELVDSFFQFSGPKKKTFYSVSSIKESTNMWEGLTYAYLTINLDPETQLYKRTVYSMLDLVGQIGGVFNVIQSL